MQKKINRPTGGKNLSKSQPKAIPKSVKAQAKGQSSIAMTQTSQKQEKRGKNPKVRTTKSCPKANS